MSFTFQQRANRKYVSSKIIYFIEYNDDEQQLKIGFNDGLIGFFKDVPKDLYSQFENAESKGTFLYKNLIDGGYEHYLTDV